MQDRDELYTTVADWLNRTDLAPALPVALGNVEAELNRVLDSGRDTEGAVTFSAGVGNAPLPTGIIALRYVLIDQPTPGYVEAVSPEELQRLLVVYGGETGAPQYVAVVGNELRVAPIPDTDYLGRAIIEGPLASLLTGGTASNWVLTDHQDIYLYGVLTHLMPFLDNDERVATWRPMFDAGLAQLAVLRDRQRWPGTQTIPLPVSFG